MIQNDLIKIKDSIEKSNFSTWDESCLKKLTGDASTRRYYRYSFKEKSFIISLIEEEETLSNFLKVRSLFCHQSIPVPDVFYYDTDVKILFQEDLGDVSLLQKISSVYGWQEVESFYKKVIDILIKVHSINIEKDPVHSIASQAFDEEKLNQEVETSFKYFLDKYLGVCKDKIKKFRAFYYELNAEISNEKRVVCHRDFHSRNIMVQNKEIKLIDFQDARMGVAQYDLVSLLEDSYTSLAIPVKESLKEYYYKKALELEIVDQSTEHFLLMYNKMALQRILKAIGSFCYIYAEKRDDRYLKYVGKSMESLRETFFKLPQPKFQEAYQLVFESYYGS